MGTPRELLNIMTGQVYRYRLAVYDHRERVDFAKYQLKERTPSDMWERMLADNKPELWRLTTEIEFFFLAVRGVLRMAEGMKRLTAAEFLTIADRVAQAVADFDRDAPQAKDIRDLLSHMDEYVTGTGWKELPNPELRAWVATPDEDTGLFFGGVVILVNETAAATEKLAIALADATKQLEAGERAAKSEDTGTEG
jgi:hypothetical protein